MKQKQLKISSIKSFLYKMWPYLRIIIAFAAILAVGALAFRSLKDSDMNVKTLAWQASAEQEYSFENGVLITSPLGVEFELNEPSTEDIEAAQVKYAEKIKRLEEEQRRKEEAERREKMIRVENLRIYLKRQGSPMADNSELILDSCEKYGMHYCKFFLSIAAVESGYGRIPIGCCNAWGMIGKYYPNWEVSIPAASDWIASHYYLKGVNTFEKLAYSSYGPLNPEKWIGDLYSFYNNIPL